MKIILFVFSVTLIGCSCGGVKKNTEPTNQTASTNSVNKPMPTLANNTTESIYGFELTDIDGEKFTLNKFKGKKILIVNTASQCGYTKQYSELEQLYQKYKEKLVVIGFPANNFGGQEPGDNKEIKAFCKKNYGVSFPLSEKVEVVGEKAAPLFVWLQNKEKNGGMETAIKWNFTKFLISEEGKLIANFPSSVKPMDEAIISKL